MRKAITLLFLLVSTFSFAQSGRMSISGKVTDTLDNALPAATLLLLEPGDSTLISYARAANDGTFSIRNIKRQPYLLKITFVGFIPFHKYIEAQDAEVDLGTIKMSEIASQLMEVVIKAAKAPMSIRGDTIEYDATTFKVPPGSSVEDLLRRLPGIQVDAEGGITSEGKNVTKVTVDGKQFFESDPKAATKNLPAEGISKIQVFDEAKEEDILTGGKSGGPSDKTMNLELKDEFKKGGFGKIVAGIGTEQRAEAKGNYNRFNEKEQFSVIGVANNTGRNGLSWNDYQDLRGSQSFNWGDDDGDYGFGGGGNYRSFSFSDDDDEGEGDLMSSFFNNSNSGLPVSYSAGLNYNYDHKKNKFTGLYFYNQKGLQSEALRTQQTFLDTETFFNRDTSNSDRVNKNQRLELRFEKEIDSLNTIIVKANGSYNINNLESDGHLTYRREDETLSNETNFNNNNHAEGWAFSGSALYRHKFRKKGRAMGLSTNFSRTDMDRDLRQESRNAFFDENQQLDSISILDQSIESVSSKQLFKANAIYTEPIGKKFFWTTFYNFNNREESVDRSVFDRVQGELQDNDFLSRYYDNRITLNRLGSYFRYSYKGVNVSLGGARQEFKLQGDYRSGPGAGISGTVDRVFPNWLPHFNVNLDLKGNRYIWGGYEVNVQEPSIRSLQPIVDNSNPLYIRVGNPELVPQVSHEVSMGYNQFNPATFVNVYGNISFSYYKDQFVSEQMVAENFITTTRTINYTGGKGVWSYAGFGFPIVKNKITTNVNYSFNYGNNISLVNNTENITKTVGNRASLRLNITPNDTWSVYTTASLNITDTKYNINTSQNQTLFNQDYDITANTKLFWGLYFNSTFRYGVYRNERFNFDQNIPILNLSLYKVVLKNNRGEIRVSLYDAFNKNRSINQNAYANVVSQTTTNALGRYAMLSFTYNMRGVTATVKKGDNWF